MTDLDEAIQESRPALSLVPPAIPVPAHFDRLRPHVEAALSEGFYTVDDVIKALAENRAQFWPGKDSVIITEIQDYPNEKVIQVWVAGGDMAEIIAMAPGIESWGRLNGCSSVLVEGRQGWNRVLKDHGYSPFSYMTRKVL